MILVGSVMGGLGLLGGWYLKPEAPKKADSFFQTWVKNEALAGASVGFCVLDEKGETVCSSPLAETALCPASALKTLTAGAAFDVLGDGFTFKTVILAGSEISSDGRVTGDLILKGGGDPTLATADLEAMAAALAKNGLKRVQGMLRVDATLFPDTPVSDHWVWGDLGNAYGAGAFGLNVDHNAVQLTFNGGKIPGAAATFLGSEPVLPDTKWDVQVTTGAAGSGDGVMIYSSPFAGKILVKGTVPLASQAFAVRGAVPDPPALAGEILRVALERRGIVFTGQAVAGKSSIIIAKHESVALVKLITHMQAVSDNLEAQCLFLMMGVKKDADPADVIKAYWESMGVSFKGLRLLDGSGLARATMIRPLDLARINYAARHSAYGDQFFTSLPANADGTLRSKRGAMSGVRSEVGFLKRGDREFTFALIGNGLGVVDFWKLRQSLLEELPNRRPR